MGKDETKSLRMNMIEKLCGRASIRDFCNEIGATEAQYHRIRRWVEGGKIDGQDLLTIDRRYSLDLGEFLRGRIVPRSKDCETLQEKLRHYEDEIKSRDIIIDLLRKQQGESIQGATSKDKDSPNAGALG